MTVYTVKNAIEIWLNGYVAGLATALVCVVTYICYKSYVIQEQKKKREIKKIEEEKKKKKKKRGKR